MYRKALCIRVHPIKGFLVLPPPFKNEHIEYSLLEGGPTQQLGAADKRPSPKHGNHHPLIIRFHRTGSPHDPHLVRWSVPSELSLGVYHGDGMTILWLG